MNKNKVMMVLLCALILYILVRKISELASGLLNGQPSLGGSSMTSTMSGAVGGTASAAGNARGAVALAKAAVDMLLKKYYLAFRGEKYLVSSF